MQLPSKSAAARFPWLKAMALASLASTLVWLVAAHTLPAYLGEVAPELALRLNPNEPRALLHLADAKLAALPDRRSAPTTAASATDSAATQHAAMLEIQLLVQRALAASPMNAHAFSVLAELAERSGDNQRALELSRAAMRRSLHESEAIYRLLQASFDARDFAESMRLADILMRTRPGTAVAVVPFLAKMAEAPAARDVVISALIANPPWRAQFFGRLNETISDARTPLELLLRLKDTPHPPTSTELRGYLQLLFRHNLHDLAYYTWLQFLPAEQLASIGLLFNGNFATEPTGLPFDWVIQAGSGVTAQIRPQPDAEHGRALNVEFNTGQVQFGGVTQILMLSPGRYVLKGRYKGDLIGRRGLKWRMSCGSDTSSVIAETPMVLGSAPKWKDFELAVTVPATGCRAQKLQLSLDARSASEQLVTGFIWYKELDLKRSQAADGAN